MPDINFRGTVRDASGAAIFLSVSGENGFHFNDSFSTSFSRTLNLTPGKYLVLITCMTDGECEFNILGQIQGVNPGIPKTFKKDQTGEAFTLII